MGSGVDFKIDGTFPHFGTDNNKIDRLSGEIMKLINKTINYHDLYRNAKVKFGLETIGLNITCGENTGATPDGRFSKSSYSLGANPVSNIGSINLLSSLKSTMKIPKELCMNGLPTTINIDENVLGSEKEERIELLINILDGFFNQNGKHIEINIVNKDNLNNYANNKKIDNLVIRNGGFALFYDELNEKSKDEFLSRNFYEVL